MQSQQTLDREADLAAMLREGTSLAHRSTEGAQFFKALLSNQVSRDVYAQLLLRLHPVYQAIEEGLDRHRHDPLLACLHRPELNRSQALVADLRFFFGDEVRLDQHSPAAQKYAGRVRDVSASDPPLLVAHSYTRYLGDLSGGQVVARRLRTAFGLDSDKGLAFYEFPAVVDADAYKKEYRQMLSALPVDEVVKARIVEEANLAFRLNREVADELWHDYLAV